MFNSVYGIYPLDAKLYPHFNLNNQRHLRTLPNVPWGSKSRTKLIPSREPWGYLAQGNNGSDPTRSGKVQVQQAMRRSVTRTSKRVSPFALQAINTVAETFTSQKEDERMAMGRDCSGWGWETNPVGVCVCVWRGYRKNLLHQARTTIPVLTGANLEQEQTLSLYWVFAF